MGASGDLLTAGQPPSATGAGSGSAQRRRRLGGIVAVVAALLVLFACYLRLASTNQVDSDGAVNALQAWDMLHGNLLLRGWHLSDVSFYTTELPEYMLVERVRGLRPDVVHICAAVTYTLLVLLAALVARAGSRGREGLVRGLLAAGILLAPGATAGVLLSVPDHTGTAVPMLLVLLLLTRARPRWYVPVIVGVILAWALLGDPILLLIGVIPVAGVCLFRAGRGLVRRESLASRWYELSLAAACGAAVAAASAMTRFIKAAGGWIVSPHLTQVVPLKDVPPNAWAALRGLLALFGAGFTAHQSAMDTIFAVLHLAGVALVVAGLCLAFRDFFRAGDLVTAVLAAAIVTNVAAYVLVYNVTAANLREVAPVVPLGAALAGRVAGGRLLAGRPGLRWRQVAAAGLVCYAAMLGYSLTYPSLPPASTGLTAWLGGHHLRSGLAGYWQAASVTLDSGGRIDVQSVESGSRGFLVRRHWEADMLAFSPRTHHADFLIATPPPAAKPWIVTEQEAAATFGRPVRVYRYQHYIIMVWNKNLLTTLNHLGPG